ncbi:MAG: thiamine pyrophosphate-binding protein [Solirubrobacterales bacterium]|nr:thiamine pyrophosphate-binding protein [Solirubrobacterales bacterium]
MPTGAQALVQTLAELGVRLVFGLPGVHNLSVFRALADSSIRVVGVRHEQAAAYAADGFARATGELGVALVTTGPGAANTLGATGEAMASRSPVLVIATDIPAALRRPGVYRGVLHETRDQAAMFAPVTKAASTVADPATIGDAIRDAAALAIAPSSGPVYLGIPTDLLDQPSRAAAKSPATAPLATPDPDLVAAAADLLARATRPLIWTGGGALRAGASAAVGELAEKLAAPVVTTFLGRGLLAADHPCAVPGPIHAPEVGPLWDEADLVLAIGTDFDGMMTQNWAMPRPPTLIAINIDAADANKNYRSDLTLVGDATTVTRALAARITQVRGDVAQLADRLTALGERVATAVNAEDPQAAAFLQIMERALTPETIVLADMCIAGYWLAGYRRVPRPRTLAYPAGWGTLGFAFPASLGAAVADRGPTVCVTGDGGFLFACGELATVVQERIPVTIVLVDDGGYGMLRFDQSQAGEAPFGVDLAVPDFAMLAEAFGLPASTHAGFDDAFEAWLVDAVAGGEPRLGIVRVALTPPPTTSPRWYRRRPAPLRSAGSERRDGPLASERQVSGATRRADGSSQR